jgi:hypothetical protein
VFDIVCYLVAVVLFGIAALLPVMPYRDRIAYAGLTAFALPFLIHAIQAR